MSYALRRVLIAGVREFLVYLGAEAGTRLAKRLVSLPSKKKPSARQRRRKAQSRGKRYGSL